MSGFRALFLIGFILGNMLLVLMGYNMVMEQVQTAFKNTYDNPAIHNVLSCNTTSCTDDLSDSLQEIQNNYQSAVDRLD